MGNISKNCLNLFWDAAWVKKRLRQSSAERSNFRTSGVKNHVTSRFAAQNLCLKQISQVSFCFQKFDGRPPENDLSHTPKQSKPISASTHVICKVTKMDLHQINMMSTLSNNWHLCKIWFSKTRFGAAATFGPTILSCWFLPGR